MKMRCDVFDLGMVPFQQAVDLQNSLAEEIARGQRPPALLLLEHPPIYTIGRTGDAKDVLWETRKLREMGIEVQPADRGGEATYHGPGQLVGYPLLALGTVDQTGRLPAADYVGYIRKLEAVLIRAMAELGLAAAQVRGNTGVWVQPDVASRCKRCPPEARKAPTKLASIGIKVDSKGVSRHGFALNVRPDMRHWEGIIACGLSDSRQISLADLLDPVPSMGTVKQRVKHEFGRAFAFHMRERTLKLDRTGTAPAT